MRFHKVIFFYNLFQLKKQHKAIPLNPFPVRSPLWVTPLLVLKNAILCTISPFPPVDSVWLHYQGRPKTPQFNLAPLPALGVAWSLWLSGSLSPSPPFFTVCLLVRAQGWREHCPCGWCLRAEGGWPAPRLIPRQNRQELPCSSRPRHLPVFTPLLGRQLGSLRLVDAGTHSLGTAEWRCSHSLSSLLSLNNFTTSCSHCFIWLLRAVVIWKRTDGCSLFPFLLIQLQDNWFPATLSVRH